MSVNARENAALDAGAVEVDFGGDASLAALLGALAAHGDKALVIDYGGRTVRPGYHITEVKAGSFVTLDCGGNPDAWQETVLQVEDLPAEEGRAPMGVAKFRAILGKVAEKVALAPEGRLTVEVGPPDQPMQVYDVGALSVAAGEARLKLMARAAICKPRHRAALASAVPACCGAGAGCC
ncbi:DUF6428 family protein [Radicibacter daui]|uniref:DUF6428 family protein n=1 Tax=Radicibacter daui TaxID=3064829 RepID=UPI004046DC99